MKPKEKGSDRFEMLTGDILHHEPVSVEAVGARIRHLMEAKGLSYEELSNMTGFEVFAIRDVCVKGCISYF